MKKIGYHNISWDIQDIQTLAEELGILLLETTETADCDALWGAYTVPQIEAAKQLTWFQSTWAGIDAILPARQFKEQTAVLCSSSGAYNRTITEYLLGGCLALLRHFPDYRDAQRAHTWIDRIPAATFFGKRITVLGMGNIGGTFAEAAAALGAEVTGIRRSNIGDLPALLPQTEILVMVLPATSATRNIIGDTELSLLPEGALVLNAGRGSTLDLTALTKHLRNGRLGGAMLDVYPDEPVSEADTLWDTPNLIMTPHIAGCGEDPANSCLVNRIFADNLKRWVKGEPLDHVISYENFC